MAKGYSVNGAKALKIKKTRSKKKVAKKVLKRKYTKKATPKKKVVKRKYTKKPKDVVINVQQNVGPDERIKLAIRIVESMQESYKVVHKSLELIEKGQVIGVNLDAPLTVQGNLTMNSSTGMKSGSASVTLSGALEETEEESY